AATNRPDVLDPALLRPGRFDRQVTVSNPDILGREQILKVHMRKVPLAPDVDARVIARGTPGFSGADLANLVNEAALMAARRDRRLVTMAEFEDAKDKVMMGAERRSMVMTEDEKRLTAYHEAGHALVGLKVPNSDPLHKVTIIPRGRALGLTMSLPERDQLSLSKEQLTSKLAMMFGGRVAEELVFGPENVTTGAGSDIQGATRMARLMVTQYGFSDKLGPLQYEGNEEEVFLGHSVTQRKNISEATAKIIDEEIRDLIDTANNTAREILQTCRADLDAIANALLEYETLSGDEVRGLLRGEPIVRPDADEPPPDQKGRGSVPTSGGSKPVEDDGPGMEPEPQPGI
ncbi:MAG: cell division protein FtsH, partial [Alphaproteobacteria bacterium]